MPEDVVNEEFTEEISEQHAGMTPLALACALNKLPSVKVSRRLQTPFVNPLKGRGINWLHFAIQV